MYHLHSSGKPKINFYNVFADFKSTLDSEMKRLQRKGEKSLTEQEEEQLWATGQLYDHSLVDIVFLCVECSLH